MKNIFNIVLLGFGLMFFSCSDILEVDLLDNPNSPTPETADLESLFNSVQLEFEQAISAPQFFTMQLARQRAFTAGSIYSTAFTPINFDNTWNQAYSDFMPDADAVIAVATPTQQFAHVGAAKVMKAYVLMQLVDLFGNVPFTEAGAGGDGNFSPAADEGSSVYGAAEALLNDAIANLTANTAAGPALDIMYGGDTDKWIEAANSLLLRAAFHKRDAGAFNAIISGGDYISGAGSDFQFEYGSSRANPDSRHPQYVNHYEASDGNYLNNWFMWAMSEDKDALDPRARGYFYRQVAEVPLGNANVFDCIFSVLPNPASSPTHYTNCNENMPYCVGSLSKGYYGRDHGNGNGIPPDGDIRTRYGVYPFGGKFDNDSFITTQNSGVDGALGAGIHPIITSFYVDFYQAEMAALSGDDAAALDHLTRGIQGSIDKVVNFITSRDPASLDEVVSVDIVTGEELRGNVFVPSQDDADAYIAEVTERFNNASDKLDVVAHEFLLATWGNGLEGYNLVRRTARPKAIQPTIQTASGSFIRSALYPAVHVNLNQNASQKDVLDQVFWDQSPADLGPCLN